MLGAVYLVSRVSFADAGNVKTSHICTPVARFFFTLFYFELCYFVIFGTFVLNL